ncbi:MAG: hypothetical protein JWO45_330 [Spartobacteria bacterium]|nr:hypothetical protein [Spartobacteria bacterium]
MKFSRREDKRAGRSFDILTDEANGVRIIVSRLGAELVSLSRKDRSGNWIGFLHRDNDLAPPAKGWGNHATVMGYYLHRLKDGRSIYRGREIKGGTHGFLRSTTWHLAETTAAESDSLTYHVSQSDFAPADYPLNVSLELTYRLADGRITTIFRFHNREPELIAHVTFGLHPGFAASSFEKFHFQMPAGKYRRHFSPKNYLSGETQDIDFDGGEMPFPHESLPGSYIIELIDVPTRDFVFSDPASGRTMVLDLTGVPYLTLWSDGGPFFCIEPCWGLTDHHQQRAFEDKEGIQKIPPGEELVAQFSMKPALISNP